MKKILPFFSYLFHPIFIAVYAALYYFLWNDTYYTNLEKYFAIFQIVVLTIVLPILVYFILRTSGHVNSIMIATISQRKIPLAIQCILTIFLIRKSITLERFPEFYFFFLGGLITTTLCLILLFFNTKASLHMVAISALTVFIMGLSIHNETRDIHAIVFVVLMNGVVASSRLVMNAHSPKELVIGFLCGIVPQLILMPLWL